MSIRVAFWNINTGVGSFKDRRATLEDWCEDIEPDVLILEEVSKTIGLELPEITGLAEVVSVKTLDKNLKESTKEIWALQSDNVDFKGKSLRMADYEGAKRMIVKLTTSEMTIWGLHANASPSGGKNAVTAANLFVRDKPAGIIGGDFNCSLATAQKLVTHGEVVSCEAWDGTALKFSQWKKAEGIKQTEPNPNLHLKTMTTGYIEVLPSKLGVIDFVIAGSDRTVTALENCSDESTWVAILKSFDHCPVVFDVD